MTAVPLILELELHTPITTTPPQDPLTAFRARNRTQLTDVIEGLRRAALDDKVAGIVARCDAGAQQLSVVQEIRDAVIEFRRSGKQATAWAHSFGELTPGTASYYLATAFDEIWLQPSGEVGLTGVSTSALFLRDAFGRLGLRPEMGQRHEYKNAADMYTQTEFTEPHREALGRIVESTADQIFEAVSEARSVDRDRLREIVDGGSISAADAQTAGLIDKVGYRDEVYSATARRVGGRMRLRYVGRYNQSRSKSQALFAPLQRKRGTVAVVFGTGPIAVGRSSAGPLGGTTIGSDTVSAALRTAARDESVNAIVFRVDSPGGSYIASDTIRREVLLARQRKPVIASMGSLAGSGGYFVTMGADVIVAAPSTITGSIGVVGGKVVSKDLLSRIGVNIRRLSVGEQAEMFAAEQPFTEDQWQILDSWLDRVYDDFTAKVAEDRGLSRDHVHEVARGRIWTGADAYERGLVDELGGLATAVRVARSRGDLPARDDLADVRPYPRVPFMERLKPAENSQSPAADAATVQPWGSLTRLALALGLPAAGPLTMPDLTM